MRARCSRRDRKESAREVRHDCGCGLDVHAQTGVACLSTKGRKEIRPVSTLTDEVLKLADWLTSAGCTPGAMESTGVYGKPVCNLLAGVVTVSLVTAATSRQCRVASPTCATASGGPTGYGTGW